MIEDIAISINVFNETLMKTSDSVTQCLMADVNRFSISLNPKLKKQQINKNKTLFRLGPFTRQLSKVCQECFCTFDLKSNRKIFACNILQTEIWS